MAKTVTERGKVLVLFGSPSDHETMKNCRGLLREFEVECEYRVASAHRSPELVRELAANADQEGYRVIIAGAGCAAHLAGAIAANTLLPVIGVPLQSGALSGLDSLLATVQMPAGVPVATVAIGDAGAKNAALLAIQILSLNDAELREKLAQYRQKQSEKALQAVLD